MHKNNRSINGRKLELLVPKKGEAVDRKMMIKAVLIKTLVEEPSGAK